jgi:hypothetical protein
MPLKYDCYVMHFRLLMDFPVPKRRGRIALAPACDRSGRLRPRVTEACKNFILQTVRVLSYPMAPLSMMNIRPAQPNYDANLLFP